MNDQERVKNAIEDVHQTISKKDAAQASLSRIVQSRADLLAALEKADKQLTSFIDSMRENFPDFGIGTVPMTRDEIRRAIAVAHQGGAFPNGITDDPLADVQLRDEDAHQGEGT